jgi:uncharacterized membrane protein YbhN (UPF0104 family)
MAFVACSCTKHDPLRFLQYFSTILTHLGSVAIVIVIHLFFSLKVRSRKSKVEPKLRKNIKFIKTFDLKLKKYLFRKQNKFLLIILLTYIPLHHYFLRLYDLVHSVNHRQ